MACNHGSYDWCGVPPLSPAVLFTGETEDDQKAYRLQYDNGKYSEWKLYPKHCMKCAAKASKTQKSTN